MERNQTKTKNTTEDINKTSPTSPRKPLTPRPASVKRLHPISPSPFKYFSPKSTSKSIRKKLCVSSKKLFVASPSPFKRQQTATKTTQSNKETKRKLEFTQTESNQDIDQTLHQLKTLIENGSFSPNNIVFKLLQDSLRWHACSNVSAMRYSDEVKQFFWTGKRLLGGQFLRFMRGYGHQGLVVQGTVPRGVYSPLDTDVNLPVPSDSSLREYRPEGIELSCTLAPGIIQENIQLYAEAAKTTSFVIMFDGKKIVPNSADIFLLGEEVEPKLADIQVYG